uniref:Uncharacterized protein n=1 Tax=Oryzias melastigma TaxID=30732 RepID=A0A3B3D2Z5_ORYME
MRKRDTVKETLELLVPRESRWVSRYRSWYTVIVVEQLLPQELISGDGLPLSAGQTGSQHSIVRQTQEDLQHQAVGQKSRTLHPNILQNTSTSWLFSLSHKNTLTFPKALLQ